MTKNATNIKKCRISESANLVEILNLGYQCYTGHFPKERGQPVQRGQLRLVWCPDSGLVQLGDTFPQSELFGSEYGYRSGLNASMVAHLNRKIQTLEGECDLTSGDIVVDIGSNDATTLKSYSIENLTKIGIDPTGKKFQNFYTNDISLIPEFFSANSILTQTNNNKVKLVTSISMFYDLDDPIFFASEIKKILHPTGIWHFEQSYLPAMLDSLSYDTICHEHVTYLSLHSVQRILASAGLKVLNVGFNDVNGGSFFINATHIENTEAIQDIKGIENIISHEKQQGITNGNAFINFAKNTALHKSELTALLKSIKNENKIVLGYGASTKGNVLLQYCEITEEMLPAIAEVNPDKFGAFTPGTNIPIISESEANRINPDYYLVLPWHFRENIIARETEFLDRGGKLIFPLPFISIYDKDSSTK